MCWGRPSTQNELFNSLIWNRCPKTEFCSADIVEIATNLAVITFNSGQGVLKGLLQRLNFHCGSTTLTFLHNRDDFRIWHAEYKGKELVKKRRRQIHRDRVITLRRGGGGLRMSLEDSNYMHQDSPGSSIHVQYTRIITTSFYVHTLYNSFFLHCFSVVLVLCTFSSLTRSF